VTEIEKELEETRETVNQLPTTNKVRRMILDFAADKVNSFDYASAKHGARIISAHYTPYQSVSLLRQLIGTAPPNLPEAMLDASMEPGHCWLFAGDKASAVIQLAHPVYPSHFTFEHLPYNLHVNSEKAGAAPKDFSVFGLAEGDKRALLGHGTYAFDIESDPLQSYPVETTLSYPITSVLLQINSNHGNNEYTCVYRFRVHGKNPEV